jgi:hypothetical protein
MRRAPRFAPDDFEKVPLVGVVHTRYDDGIVSTRAKLALRTANNYARAKLPLVFFDSSQPDTSLSRTFADEAGERGAIVISAPRPGLATQVIDGVNYVVAHGANRVVRHEPEKIRMPYFKEDILGALALYDMVIIGRTEHAMQSLPTIQEATERHAGRRLELAYGLPADSLSGGRGYTQVGAAYLSGYDVERYGNNWLHLYEPAMRAMVTACR